MGKPNFSAEFPNVTLRQIEELKPLFNGNKTQLVIRAIAELYRQEIATMKHEFATKADALAAGYRSVLRHGPDRDKDVSGPNSFGYDFQDAAGNETVTVWFTEEKNKLGRPGCFIPMFPPATE